MGEEIDLYSMYGNGYEEYSTEIETNVENEITIGNEGVIESTTLDPIVASEIAAHEKIRERLRTMSTVSPEVEPESGWRPTPLSEGPAGEKEPYPEGESVASPEPEGEPGVYAEPAVPLFSDKDGKPVYGTLAAVVATGIILLNIAVLVVLARKPKQRRSLSYLIGLTATFDMLGGFQFLWFSSFDLHLMYTHQGMWILIMCGIWMLTMAPQISALMHFGLHLLDELTVGVNNAKITAGRIIFILTTVFALPIALFIPPVAGWNCIGCRTDNEELGPDYCQKKCSMAIFPFVKIYVLMMVCLLFGAIALVVGIYSTIYYKICQKRCQRQLSPKSGNTDIIKVTTLILAVYILCTVPVSIVMLFDYLQWEYNATLITAFHGTLFVSFLNNLINPIIVFCTLPSMRSTKWDSGCNSCENSRTRTISSSKGSTDSGSISVDEEKKVPLDDDQVATKI